MDYTIKLKLSTGKEIELTKKEIDELKAFLKEQKEDVFIPYQVIRPIFIPDNVPTTTPNIEPYIITCRSDSPFDETTAKRNVK